jgi:hypothetical protein
MHEDVVILTISSLFFYFWNKPCYSIKRLGGA